MDEQVNNLDIINLVEFLVASSSSSSSSSSDDEDMFFPEMYGVRTTKHRITDFVSDIVENYSELEFRQNFRVSRGSADMLIDKFQQSAHYRINYVGGREAVDAKTQIYAFLWYAGNKATYREVSNLFNIAKSTMHRQLNLVLDFFYEISAKYIKFPNCEMEKETIASKFTEICAIQNVIGCIDGSYIPIRKPANKIRSTYINRHDRLSITLQGICDADKRFIDVFIGSPSKIHDARVFQLSFISDKLPTICGSQYHILGDAAYPLREYLMTPFKDSGRLTAAQRRYNYKHAKGRVKIENVFGLLKNRFRQLLTLEFFKVLSMCRFVLAVCVLHNMCIYRCDTWPEENVDSEPETPIEPEETQATMYHRRLGEMKRNGIVLRL